MCDAGTKRRCHRGIRCGRGASAFGLFRVRDGLGVFPGRGAGRSPVLVRVRDHAVWSLALGHGLRHAGSSGLVGIGGGLRVRPFRRIVMPCRVG